MKRLAIALLALGALSIFLVGCTPEQVAMMEQESGHNENAMIENKGQAMEKDDTAMEAKGNTMMEKKDEAMMMEKSFSGKILADQSMSKYIEFNQADYNKALEEGKTIVLNFYASWCPSCQAEQPEAIAAFNELDDENIVGFQVNYKDPSTDDLEEDLAREYGISYQHTKVIIQNGERVLKSPESWDTNKYLTEINAVL